jgi:hypothetical protein
LVIDFGAEDTAWFYTDTVNRAWTFKFFH